MAEIFISYARPDRAFVEKLAAALETHGHSVWWDRDIGAGEAFHRTIEQQLNTAKAVIVVWSANANESEWVRDEASLAREQHKLFPIRIDGGRSPLGFQQYQAVDFSEWNGAASAPPFSTLLRAIRQRFDAPQNADTGTGTNAPPPSRTSSASRKPLVIGGAAALIVAIIAAGYFFTRGAPAPNETVVTDVTAAANELTPEAETATAAVIPFVAVLPFKSTGSDDGGFLADGLHDDLLTRLAKLDAFKVISRTSMLEYADRTKNMRQIGEELGAKYILEGGVQALGNRVRVNAQLINAPTDEHIWAETFDRELTAKDLFDIQAELAVAIAAEMKTALSPEDQAVIDQIPTQNIEAYNAYLRALRFDEESGPSGIHANEAIDAYEEAIRLDPDFALAWAKLATRLTTTIYDAGKKDENRYKTLNAIAYARALAPDLLESELAWVDYVYRGMGKYEQALDLLAALEERYPTNATLMELKSYLLRRVGRFEEAHEAMAEADRLSPQNLIYKTGLITMALSAGNCEAAAEHVRSSLEKWPDVPSVILEATNYEIECTGNLDRAEELINSTEMTTVSLIWQARNICMMRRDFQRCYELSLITTPESDPFESFDDTRFQARTLIFLGRKEEAGAVIKKAANILAAFEQEGDSDIVQSTGFANRKAQLYALQENAAETLRWTRERQRRFLESQIGNDKHTMAQAHFWDANSLACAGLKDEAVEELRLMLEEPGGFLFTSVDPWPHFDGLRDHPGYIALKEKFGSG